MSGYLYSVAGKRPRLLYQCIPIVVASATKSEYASAFLLGQAATRIIHTLTDLGYPQSETEIICDNECAVGIAQNTLQIKRTKTIDMHYDWLRDQVHQKKLKVIRKMGKINSTDFFTKTHAVYRDSVIRRKYVLHDARHSYRHKLYKTAKLYLS